MVRDFLEKQKNFLFNTLEKEIKDRRVLDAMKQIPREEFIPKGLKELAYIDSPLDIGHDQTISQPYVVALMCEMLELKESDKVLDIGTGSGYLAAILSKLCKEVVTVEIVPEFVDKAKERFKELEYTNITAVQGDGNLGCPEMAPYDKIVCSAFVKDIPSNWREQITKGGVIVAPLEKGDTQELVRVRYMDDRYFEEYFGAVTFVPLVSAKE